MFLMGLKSWVRDAPVSRTVSFVVGGGALSAILSFGLRLARIFHMILFKNGDAKKRGVMSDVVV